jgi:hypothetical protein
MKGPNRQNGFTITKAARQGAKAKAKASCAQVFKFSASPPWKDYEQKGQSFWQYWCERITH